MSIYLAHFFAVMPWFLRLLTSTFVLGLLISTASISAAPTGFLEGHLKIISPKEVELADGTPSKITAENYADYSLVILSRDKMTEVAHVMADEQGNYRIALPPGDYLLDIQNRRQHVRASPQPFTVVANQTVHVDMNIDTGIR